MNRRTVEVVVDKLEQIIPWLTLLLLLTYTFAEFFYAPYLGFDFNPSNGTIQDVFGNTSALQPGDKLYRVDDLAFEKWAESLRHPLVASARPGDTIALQVYRDGQIQDIAWTISQPTWDEILARTINIWPLGYFFWIAGVATLLSLRPKNGLQQLFALFFFLTAIWIVAGNVSRWNVWEASIVFRMAIWLCVPVYLHLHWSFPKNLRPLPPFFFPFLYLLGVCAALLQWFELLPKQAYVLGFVVALLGSLVFLLIHFVRRPSERQQVTVILYSFVFALLPSALLGVAAALNSAPRLGGIALLTLPVLPVGYFYAIYRNQSGVVEMRANRAITLFLYLILLGTAVVALGLAITRLPTFPGRTISAILTISLGAVLLTLRFYSRFERWIEVHFLGIPYSIDSLVESYLLRITTSLTKTGLVPILRDEIAPSLLIRQSALLLTKGTQGECLYFHGVAKDSIPPASTFSELLHGHSSHPLRSLRIQKEAGSWAQVCLPLILGDRLLGFWLLGKHDPDDLYTGREIAILENIARQTAMALVNIEQAEQLQMFYQADIQRHEAERARLARTLHDEILNQAAIAYTSLDAAALSERFETEYDLLKQQIRRMISDLRPATLRWGLPIALEELVDELNERANGACTFELAIPDSQARYPVQSEEQLYRIVQQACENALRHSQADHVQIAGHLWQDEAEIYVEDDGIGFDSGEINLSSFLEHKHYGLAGMYERAEIISARFYIDSVIGRGTAVHVIWLNDATGKSPGLNEEQETPGSQYGSKRRARVCASGASMS